MPYPPRLFRHCTVALAIISVAATMTSCSIVIKKKASGPVTYYVSRSGNDAASGTSPTTAWQTLSRVNSAAIAPGAKVLFHGGERFNGRLKLGKQDAGNASNPVTIGSYGTGTATIHAPGGTGITVFDTAGVDIHGLKLVGSGKTGSGIGVYSDMPAGKRLRHIFISDVQVHGFRNGISIGGLNAAAGFADIKITDSTSYRNVDSGLLLFGPAFDAKSPTYANEDVLISRMVARDNLGDPAKRASDSGNGIVLGSVSQGSITWSTAKGNGGKGNAGQEGAGIWAYDSAGVTITHNLSYGNKTKNRIDGDGFDLDENTSDCVLENNLSYGNDGAGFLVYSPLDNAAENGDVIRNNISSNDVRDGSSGYGGITATGYVSDLAVYQNTVVAATSSPALRIGSELQRVIIANNIFTTQSGPIFKASDSLGSDAVTFRGNDYYSTGTWKGLWGAQSYRSFPSWQAAASQEMRNGQSTGHALAPRLAGPILGLAAESPTDTAVLRGFQLASGSPLSGAGLDLATLGLSAGSVNFLGHTQAVPHPNIGAL
ncbi:MAG: right-handed parallel beta-helix repeat-containing protein [Trebonia sp.]